MTKRLAVLGSPISHSKSPAINRAAFEYLGVDATYEKFELAHGLASWIEQSGVQWDLLAVTMPLKLEALALSTSLDGASQNTRSTNCLIRVGEGYLGYNTDPMGLQMACSHLRPETVAVLGTGATARSALYAFRNTERLLWGRNEQSALSLAEEFGARSTNFERAIEADLVISTLPIGVLPGLLDSKQGKSLLDVAYANGKLSGFEETISGVEMLIWQAIGQLRYFLNGGKAFEDEPKLHELMLRAASMGE
jgi:shikimate dehydrogenase